MMVSVFHRMRELGIMILLLLVLMTHLLTLKKPDLSGSYMQELFGKKKKRKI